MDHGILSQGPTGLVAECEPIGRGSQDANSASSITVAEGDGVHTDSCSCRVSRDQALFEVAQSRIRIADIIFEVSGLTDGWVWADRKLFEPFITDDPPGVLLRVHLAPIAPQLVGRDLAYSIEGLRSVYLDRNGWAFEFYPYDRATFPQRPPHQLLTFDRRFTVGDLYVSPGDGAERPTFTFSLFLFELWTDMLPFYDGLILHASGISDAGQGIVFSGAPGAGKTTLAGIWEGCQGVRVLNDDRCILRKNERQWWVYPVAGIGEVRPDSPAGAPLEAIFLISHAEENVVQREDISRAATSLMAHFSLPPYDPGAVDLGLALLEDLVTRVPVYQLGFVPDENVIDLIRDVVRGRCVPEST